MKLFDCLMGKRKSGEKLKNVSLEEQLVADAVPRQRDRKKTELRNEQHDELSVISLGKKEILLATEIRSESDEEEPAR